MTLAIYYARSIRGGRTHSDNAFHAHVAAFIKRCGHSHQFDTEVTIERSGLTTDEYIKRRDTFWIDRSDALIAEVSNPSHGVGIEIAYAHYVWHLPILLIAEKDSVKSAMLSGFEHYSYRGQSDLEAYLEVWLSETSRLLTED